MWVNFQLHAHVVLSPGKYYSLLIKQVTGFELSNDLGAVHSYCNEIYLYIVICFYSIFIAYLFL
jgi:hypothetical protein